MDPITQIPRFEIRWLVNREHVSTPAAEIVADLERRMTGPGWTDELRAEAIAYALECHARNLAEYLAVTR